MSDKVILGVFILIALWGLYLGWRWMIVYARTGNNPGAIGLMLGCLVIVPLLILIWVVFMMRHRR